MDGPPARPSAGPGLRGADLYARQMNLDQIDWSVSSAYRLKVFPSVEGIVLNVSGRQAQGIVEPGPAYEALRDQLLAELADLRDPATGQPIVACASRREDLFEGPFVDDIPDILLDSTAGHRRRSVAGRPGDAAATG